ncbi:hypothetical protein HER39_05530, partial [Arthrobacter deserti]|nr:hypothetical protein [Arthrobacter deserti]
AVGVGLTVFAGPLFQLSDQAAGQMLGRTPYIDAMLGPGTGAGAGPDQEAGQ